MARLLQQRVHDSAKRVATLAAVETRLHLAVVYCEHGHVQRGRHALGCEPIVVGANNDHEWTRTELERHSRLAWHWRRSQETGIYQLGSILSI